MKALQGVRGNNPPVTASPCQPPLGKGAMGTGVRIATTSLRTGLAMTHAPRYLDGKRVQLLDIYYSGVGILHELTPEEMEEAFQQHLAQRDKEKTA